MATTDSQLPTSTVAWTTRFSFSTDEASSGASFFGSGDFSEELRLTVVLELDTDSESSHLTRFSCDHSAEVVSTPHFSGHGDPLKVALVVTGELLLAFVICI